MPWTGGLAPAEAPTSGSALYKRDCAACHRDDRQGTPPAIASLVGIGERKPRSEIAGIIRKGGGRMAGFPTLPDRAVDAIVEYLVTGNDVALDEPVFSPTQVPYRFTGYRKFLDPDGYPAVQPPWGTLNAINLNTGDHAWQIPLGEYPELAAKGVKNTGTENYGGPVVTAGGLVFIGATNFDRKFRAFDKKSRGAAVGDDAAVQRECDTGDLRGGRAAVCCDCRGWREGAQGRTVGRRLRRVHLTRDLATKIVPGLLVS